ncbi:hypothetical protein MTR67_002834 [Solanum verrucosum]|uniref:Chromo domain-containing protein n=1 Tax=Solanum verrucosum TaxID=315347 RepID=A0AAF0PQX8_SOLVR|nr:hypothetical protein MTR67_002834 [Solanum verrucosum]
MKRVMRFGKKGKLSPRLRTKEVASVKVLWRNQFVEEATWEAEEDMKKRYPYLFESGGNADQAFQLTYSYIQCTDASWPASYDDADAGTQDQHPARR